jgi:excisionase family DNA binding protein
MKPAGPRQRQYYTVAEAAEILGLSKSAVYEAAKSGALRPTKRIGKALRIYWRALEPDEETRVA